MITMTREDIQKVMDEFIRRMKIDIKDETIPMNARYIREEIVTRMQGVYGTIMAVVPNRNWQDITWWIDEELDRVYNEFGITAEPRKLGE